MYDATRDKASWCYDTRQRRTFQGHVRLPCVQDKHQDRGGGPVHRGLVGGLAAKVVVVDGSRALEGGQRPSDAYGEKEMARAVHRRKAVLPEVLVTTRNMSIAVRTRRNEAIHEEPRTGEETPKTRRPDSSIAAVSGRRCSGAARARRAARYEDLGGRGGFCLSSPENVLRPAQARFDVRAGEWLSATNVTRSTPATRHSKAC